MSVTNVQSLFQQGYIGLVNTKILQATIATLCTRKGKTMIKWIKGHSGHERNEGADQMANIGALKDHLLGQHQNPTSWITCGLYKGTQRF